MTKFILHNANPINKKAPDCVIRAICFATNQDRIRVFKDLCEFAIDQYSVPNDKKVYEKYLKELGYEKQPMPKIFIGKRYLRQTVSEFAMNQKEGIYLLQAAGHLTVVKNGDIYDTRDCGNKSVGNYYKIK